VRHAMPLRGSDDEQVRIVGQYTQKIGQTRGTHG
jgi:hypothetical protein